MDAVRSWLHLLGHGISSLPGEISGGEDEGEARVFSLHYGVIMRIIKILGATAFFCAFAYAAAYCVIVPFDF